MKYEFKGGSIWNDIKIISTFYIHEAEKEKKNKDPRPLDSLNYVTNFN